MWSKGSTYLILSVLMCCPFLIIAQSFHRQFNQPQNLFSQKIIPTMDGGYCIGDSYLTEGEIYLTKFFSCGEIDWSHRYKIDGAFAQFKNFVMNSDNELLVYGSYFVGSDELIFLQKVDSYTGTHISFSTFDPNFRDHFTYTIDIRGGKVLIFGLLLDFNIERRGMIAVLDKNLNLDWAKHFTPFEKEGEAIVLEDGFMCRSEIYHFRFSLEGELVWAQILESPVKDLLPIGGPYEVGNGFLYEATIGKQNFFYLLDGDGDLSWKSQLFSSTGERSSLASLNTDTKLVLHYFEEDDIIKIGSFELNQNGEIRSETFLTADRSFISGEIFHLISESRLTIVGSPNPFTIAPNAYQDFMIQQNREEFSICYEWESVNTLTANEIELNFVQYNFENEVLDLTEISSKSVVVTSYDLTFEDICFDVPEGELLVEKGEITCGERINLTLPSSEYLWDDLKNNDIRVVSEAGIYKARTKDCDEPQSIEYQIESPDCDCNFFLPNIFSPNEDGVNDELVYSSSCRLIKLEITVFNRWGEKVYQNNVIGNYWDGSNVEVGIYMIFMEYETLNEDGTLVLSSVHQDVTVLR